MIPIWIKITYTAFVIITVVIYFKKYGPGNFLWFSDIALITMVPALWMESRLLASMMAIGTLLPEIFWNISFLVRILMGKRMSGLTDYMFESKYPLYLRAISLFHIFLPALIIWTIAEFGYEPVALYVQTLLSLIVFPLSYLLTDPKENVNWVHGPGREPQKLMHPLLYLGLLMIMFPVVIYLPTHLILKSLFNS
jgi:hypothetical protein